MRYNRLIVLLPAIALCLQVAASHAQFFPSVRYLTRAEASKLLLSYSRRPVQRASNTDEHPDVLGNQWYTPFVMEAINLGMLSPDPLSNFVYPHRSVSRAEFVKMIAIAFDLETPVAHSYRDIPQGAWYEPYIGLATRYQLFQDHDQSLFHPSYRITHNESNYAMNKIFQRDTHLRPAAGPPPSSAGPVRIQSTPEIVKQAMMRLFRMRNVANPNSAREQILLLVNAERTKAQLPPLTSNSYLEKSAQDHAKDMHQQGYFSHFTPDGADYIDRIRAAGYLKVDQEKCGCRSVFNIRALIDKNRTVTTPTQTTAGFEICGCKPRFSMGENIAKGQLTPEQVMEDWMESTPHKNNILHPQFEEIGIGLFGNYWVQNFGRVRLE